MARILTVDDEPAIRTLISRLLQRRGHEVHQANHGPMALQMAADRSFDIALVDYHLPGLNGLEVMSRLRELQPGCLRILVTGMLDLPIVVDAVNRGEVSRVVEKPFDDRRLVDAVESALDTRKRMVEVARVQQAAAQIEEQRMLTECFSEGLIQLALQPILDSDTGRVAAFEALLRSQHPVLDGPLSVLRASERCHRLGDLADTVFGRAEEWLTALPPSISLFLNIHPDDLADPAGVARRLERLSPWASRVVLEITERSRLQRIAGWEETLGIATQMGFAIAVDDLGSGYNSLSILADLQPRYVKVDMSIVRGIDQDPRKWRLVEMLARFSEATGSSLVAEGVETAAEAEALQQCGAHLLQGYLFARPSLQRDAVLAHLDRPLWQPRAAA